ncbi:MULTISPECIES: DotH/IcmK family type IV secretion protein [Cysteiniphilum]|uniref:DotH/IcmK family type IV secretion protein n=1 Tax=Cysteiniphilum TaxID=2056696 RepID=UPI0017877A5B|nr:MULTISPECIES: DotH/IcmK family type IV secretion protein [Cysteiniphilum]
MLKRLNTAQIVRRLVACLGCIVMAMLFLQNSLYADTASKPLAANNEQAFNNVLRQDFAMSPTQIEKLKTIISAHQQATELSPGETLSAKNRTLSASIKPGNTKDAPLVIVTKGMVTSVVITDQNGSPWPLDSFTVGNPDDFNVKQSGKSVLLIQALKSYSHTNIALMLSGVAVPLMINVISGQDSYDSQDYIQVQASEAGDQNQAKLNQAPKYLRNLLAGISLAGAKALTIETDSDAKMWDYQGKYLLLTSSTLSSPGFDAQAYNTMSHMHAYSLTKAPYILLTGKNGSTQTIQVTGEEQS